MLPAWGLLTDRSSPRSHCENCEPTRVLIRAWDPHITNMTTAANNNDLCSASHAVALDMWESEGGAIRAPIDGHCDRWTPVSERQAYVLQCLGAAVLSQWNGLPSRIQHELFEHSFDTASCGDAARLRKRIARFLHEHKDDAGGAK